MVSQYPGTLDTFNTPASNNRLNNPSHTALHNKISDAVINIETELGTNLKKVMLKALIFG
jgi:hypothetical protein